MKGNLTKRELDILILISKGFDTKKIATELSISTKTVETHRKNIKHKFGFNNFYRVISFAFENKILSIEKTDDFV